MPTATGGRAEIVVHEIASSFVTPPRCRRWAEQVQAPFITPDPARADRDWDWEVLIPTLTFAAGVRRQPRMFQISLAATDFPLGMVALLENERWIGRPRQSAVYLLYLSGAPAAAFAAWDEGGRAGAPKLLTAAGLDVAVSVSLNGPAQGRLWLHAAPEGGEGLLAWYRGRGLEPVPAGAKLPSPVLPARRNDGRYFQLTARRAVGVSRQLDGFRH